MKTRHACLVLLGLVLPVAAATPIPAPCPGSVNFYRTFTQGIFDYWQICDNGVLVKSVQFSAGGSPTFFTIEDGFFFSYRLTSPSPFTQRWQLYRDNVLVSDFTVYNKSLTLAQVKCNTFFFYRSYVQEPFRYWEVYLAPAVTWGDPYLIRSFRFLLTQQPTFWGVDDQSIYFYRQTIQPPFQYWELYQNDQLLRSFHLNASLPLTLANVDDGVLYLYIHTTQNGFDNWQLYRDDALVQSFRFYNKTPTLVGVNDNTMFFTRTLSEPPFTVWEVYVNDQLTCRFRVFNLNLIVVFHEECLDT